jgi:hypothetical protein
VPDIRKTTAAEIVVGQWLIGLVAVLVACASLTGAHAPPSRAEHRGNWELVRDGSLPNELDGEAMAWGVKAYSTRLQELAAQLQDAESTNV